MERLEPALRRYHWPAFIIVSIGRRMRRLRTAFGVDLDQHRAGRYGLSLLAEDALHAAIGRRREPVHQLHGFDHDNSLTFGDLLLRRDMDGTDQAGQMRNHPRAARGDVVAAGFPRAFDRGPDAPSLGPSGMSDRHLIAVDGDAISVNQPVSFDR